MNIQCYCGKGFELPYTERKQLLQGFTNFCSGACLFFYLETEGSPIPMIDLCKREEVYHGMMDDPFDYYCKYTSRFYRSKMEAAFAEWCNRNAILWEYEPYTIQVSTKHWYTPDFWLRQYGHFVEVKGEWSGSAKRKLRTIKQNSFNVLLLPKHLIIKLSKENNNARRKINKGRGQGARSSK